MSIELKIKAKHLALEPAIIRKEEQKILKQIRSGKVNDTIELLRKFNSLHDHRVWNVRNEARATHLARAYINGKAYNNVEHKVHDKSVLKCYILPRVVAMVAKYGPNEDRIHKTWIQKLMKMDFRKEEYQTLQEKIEKWFET